MRTKGMLKNELQVLFNQMNWENIHTIFKVNHYTYYNNDEVPSKKELQDCVNELIDRLLEDDIKCSNSCSMGRFTVGYDTYGEAYIAFTPEYESNRFGPNKKQSMNIVKNHVESAIKKYCVTPMEWMKDFWNEMLKVPLKDRHLVIFSCDNDMTEIYVGEEFPKYGTDEYKDVMTIDSGITEGRELIEAIGFKVI